MHSQHAANTTAAASNPETRLNTLILDPSVNSRRHYRNAHGTAHPARTRDCTQASTPARVARHAGIRAPLSARIAIRARRCPRARVGARRAILRSADAGAVLAHQDHE